VVARARAFHDRAALRVAVRTIVAANNLGNANALPESARR
jgi:hypothetical protein